jgi:hypothetical protein
MPLAQLNVAHMRGPLDSPEMAGFVARLAAVNAAADESDGFIWRLQDEDGPGATSYRVLGDDTLLVNLSVWRDLAALRAFVVDVAGHREALQARREWFERASEPMTVCWYIEEGHTPSVEEAEVNLVRLRNGGSSAGLFAFTYRD